MATLAREVERPAFLAAQPDAQLSLSAGVAPRESATGRGRAPAGEPTRAPLSERLRHEVARDERAATANAGRTTVLRRGGEATLDELLVGAWEGLSAHRSVVCPVCAAAMAPRSEAAGGACGGCGSQLR